MEDNHTADVEGIQERHLKLVSICLALVLLTIIAFWPVRNFGFVNFDDDIYIYTNNHVNAGLCWESIKWAFSADSSASPIGHWHPVTWLSLMLDHELFGLNPHGYHLMNLFFHILNTLLLFLIFNRMTKALWRSAIVAALFAIHPLHVESVAWVAERKDVLSTFFWMLTTGVYVLYAERRSFIRYFTAVAFFTIGLMAKSMLVTLPLALFLMDYWPLTRFRMDMPIQIQWQKILQLIWEKTPFFAIACIFSIIANKTGHLSQSLPFSIRISNTFKSYIIYIFQMIWPMDLTFLYPFSEEIPLWQVIGAIVILLSVSVIVIRFMKKFPFFIIGWFWYIITLIPVIGIVQAGTQAHADRYTYVPLIGLFVMASWGFYELIKGVPYHRIIADVAALIIIITLVILSNRQVLFWKDSIALTEHALAITKNNYRAHNNLALSLIEQGRTVEAYSHLLKAILINPNIAEQYNNIGNVASSLGRQEEAVGYYERAIEINPKFAMPYFNLGRLLKNAGKKGEAEKAYKKGLEIDPGFVKSYEDRGINLAGEGKLIEALDPLKVAVELNPESIEAQYFFGTTLAALGNLDEAAMHLQDVVRLKPDMAEAHFQLGMIALARGRKEEALSRFRKTLRLQPDFEKAKIELMKLGKK
ncbi:MAG: tetratricopeptide repeat protein [Syntrophales bacterium]